MSLFSDFQNAWSRRFPDCELPQAWEEDVRANLIRHGQRVTELREELEKECFYVEYLERLLADAENHRRRTIKSELSQDSNNTSEQRLSSLERSPLSGEALEALVPSSEGKSKNGGRERSALSLIDRASKENIVVDGTEKQLDQMTSSPMTTKLIDEQLHSSCSNREITGNQSMHLCCHDNGDTEPEADTDGNEINSLPSLTSPPHEENHFITVIEVNGFGKPTDKTTRCTKPLPSKDSVDEDDDDSSKLSSLDSPSMNTARSSDSSQSSPAVKKKVPPKPPPKRPKRPLSEQNVCQGTTESKEADDQKKVITRPSQSCTSPPLNTDDERDSTNSKLQNPKSFQVSASSGVILLKSDSFKSSCSDTSTREDSGHPGNEGKKSYSQHSTKSGGNSEEESCHTHSSDKSLDYDDLTLKSQASILSGHSSHSGCLSDGDPTSGYTEDGQSADDDEEGGDNRDLDEEGNDEDSPKYSDYVNIDYFLRRRAKQKRRATSRGDSVTVDSDDDDDGMGVLVHTLVRDIEKKQMANRLQHQRSTEKGESFTSPGIGHPKDSHFDEESEDFGSSVDSPSFLCPSSASEPSVTNEWSPPQGGNSRPQGMDSAETERITIIKCIVNSILESESIYCDCLNVLLQYMKALRSTVSTSQPVISQDDLSLIFYKIPDLYAIHQKFYEGVRNRLQNWDGKLTIGDHFKILASRLSIYGMFLRNYSKAIETVRKCSSENAKFDEIMKAIKLKALQGQVHSLEDLLHIPVVRVQKIALVLHDLLKYTPDSHPDFAALQDALKITQCFLNEFNMSATEYMFQGSGRTQRLLVKNSFIVELSEGHRKLRHLFLFNDVIVCAKYKKVSGREKFTYEVKWYVPLKDVVLPQIEGDDKDVKETSVVNVLSLKSQVTNVRDLIMQEECANKIKCKANSRNMDKLRKKLAELQAQLMLASPNLVFRIGQKNGRKYIFFLSSKFECSQWQEAISALQAHVPPVGSNLTLYEIQAWISVSHRNLQTNMGSFLLRSGTEDDVLVGDLYIIVHSLQGLNKPTNMFLSLELDSYGHFFRKATTKVAYNTDEPVWNQDFIIELEGSHMLRILCYEYISNQDTLLRAKGAIELNKSWLTNQMQEKKLPINEFTVSLSLKFVQSEMSLRRTPSSKPCGIFGMKLSHVLKKEKRTIPFLIACCVREVDKRGLKELGIYRVSGSTSEMQKLKRYFETNPYEAEQLIKEIDIHSVTGILKLYLRELPEGLFTDELYPKFLEAFGKADHEEKSRSLLQLYDALPASNKAIVSYLIDHMIRIIHEEVENKMSLQNVATVFGPTLLRLSAKQELGNTSDKLAAGTIDVMAQAGILYFYLKRQAGKEALSPSPQE